jgi:hypothetical protein
MRANHVHVGVRDLPAALVWLERIWELKQVLQIPQMAILVVGDFHWFLHAANHDSRATVEFATDDGDRDYTHIVLRGAIRVGAPEDQP